MNAIADARPAPPPDETIHKSYLGNAPDEPVPDVPPATRYVVLIGVIAPRVDGRDVAPERVRGDVATCQQLGGPAQVRRFLCRTPPAIREANAFEATQRRVAVGDRADVSTQEALDRARREADALRVELAQAEADKARLRGLAAPPRTFPPRPARN